MAENDDTKGTVRKACIIGAGSSGIAACKTLQERGIPFDCFELGSGIGGMWRYHNDNGLSSAYKSLHINTSRDTMAYSDFPLPLEWPPFPDHTLVLKYFESYVDHFGFRDTITFRTKVERVTPAEDGDWDVTVVSADGQRRTNRYGAVLVANGHHWNPRLPEFPGEFHGQQLHSHDYREPGLFAGEARAGGRFRQLVVRHRLRSVARSPARRSCRSVAARTSFRNTCSAGRWTRSCRSSSGGGSPGGPSGRSSASGCGWLAATCRGTAFPSRTSRAAGASHDFRRHLQCHRARLPEDQAERAGAVRRRGAVRRWKCGADRRHRVVHRLQHHVSVPRQERAGPDEQRGLAVPPGCDPTIRGCTSSAWCSRGRHHAAGRAQSIWVADILSGKTGLPDREAMIAEIQRHRASIGRRYTRSTRHTIQVDFYPYRSLLAKTSRRGRRWAKRPLNPAAEMLPRSSVGWAEAASAAGPSLGGAT